MAGSLAGVEAFALDVDGTLVLADDPSGSGGLSPLPGAVEVLATLRARGTRFVCFTNGSGQVPAAQAARLRAAGLDIADTELLTPASVAALYVRAHHPGQAVLAFGNAGLLEPLRAADVVLCAGADGAGVVLVGADPDFTYAKLVAACRAVWAGAPLLVTSMAPYFAGREGRMPSTSGAIAAGIVHATGVRPIVLGKPSTVAMDAVCSRLGVAPARICVVGDDQHLEIRMGQAARARTVLVLTGSTRPEEIEAPLPDAVLPTIGGLLDEL